MHDLDALPTEMDSLAFCERVFLRISGPVRVTVNGRRVSFDRVTGQLLLQSVITGESWMPARAFLSHLSVDESTAWQSLPSWDGRNERQLSTVFIHCVEQAINRYQQNRHPVVDYITQETFE